MLRLFAALAVLTAAACSPQPGDEGPMPVETASPAAEVPAEVLALIHAEDAAFAPEEAIEDATTGARTYRVTGASGEAETTYQLMHFNEGWRIVSIRRDIDWSDAPASVRRAVAASPAAVTPTRVVRVREPGADGVIYELWSGEPEMLAMSVREAGGQAAIMPAPH
jgi:hypothetical protein